ATVAAQQMPPYQNPPPGPGPGSGPGPGPGLGKMDPNSRAMVVDPGMQSLLDGMEQPGSGAVMVVEPTNSSASRPMKTGIRKGRSRFQIVMWIFIGGLVIGGGVFAGFQIRSMRLAKQIDAARANAVDNAKADTWRGWLAARDSLGGIAQASSTVENRAALARARGLLAFEFGEGVPEAKIAVDNLGEKGGLDAALGTAYVALARNEPKAAKLAVERATAIDADAAETLYVSGQLALLVGEIKTAQKQLQAAVAKAPRALYYVGLARAQASVSAWEDAISAVDKALELSPEHPGALIERAKLLAASGRLGPKSPLGDEVRKQLEKLLAEGGKSIADQPRGVSPLQLTFTHLALAQVAFAMADAAALDVHLNAAVKVNIEDPRFAELISETVLMAGTIRQGNLYAEKAALATLAGSPSSRRAMVVLAESLLVQGKAGDALDYLLGKGTDATSLPRGMAVRGHIKLALDDVAGARADFDAVEKLAPKLELAVIGLAMADLASDDPAAALARLEKAYKPTAATLAMSLAYASALRATGDPASRDKAKALLDKLVPAAIGFEAPYVQLELARVNVDLGLVTEAKRAFAEVAKSPNVDLRLQAALYLIDEQDAAGGRAAIEAILKTLADASRKPAGRLLVEAARARTLLGDHAGAEGLLTQAENAKATQWRVDRERARLRLRKGDTTGAADKLLTAIETSGADLETLLLAADVRYVDLATQENKLTALAEKLRTAVATHLKELPEAAIIDGKLALAAGKNDEAEKLYTAALAAFEKDKVVSRRSAQAHFGLAVVEYNRESLTTAKDKLDLAIAQDSTLYDAYLFQADLMLRTKDLKKALEKAKKATVLNGDSVQGWQLIGLIAAEQANRKLLAEAIARLTELAPDSPELKELQALLAR
ncbi:MAG: tetratricopeptide repeat protein, partial [Deltaproteobacteria bacterium]|nr:tetratricopeptide repeat protein [Deltaproteobacteria bacterium]